MEKANIAILIVTALSALGALWAALAAWKSAKETRRAYEGQLFSGFYDRYGAPEMVNALRLLRNWEAENGEKFVTVWRSKLAAGYEPAQAVDYARRHVKFHFLSALRLYKSCYVSEDFLKQVCNLAGINILYDIVEPLEFGLDPAFDKSEFDTLRRICGRHGKGTLKTPIPTPGTIPLGRKYKPPQT